MKAGFLTLAILLSVLLVCAGAPPSGHSAQKSLGALRERKERRFIRKARTKSAVLSIPPMTWPDFVTVRLEGHGDFIKIERRHCCRGYIDPVDGSLQAVDERGREIKSEVKCDCEYFAEDLGGGLLLDMIEIPEGVFQIGSPKREAGRYPNEDQLKDLVSVRPFFMSRCEITQGQWRAIMGSKTPIWKEGDDFPVVGVSWEDAWAFCIRLSLKTGKSYRLPTEQQWEYACRSGTSGPFASGATITSQIVNYDGRFPYGERAGDISRGEAMAVGSLGVANEFGLFDMHGNVWEWTADILSDKYDRARSVWASRSPNGSGDPENRVLRGGSFKNDGAECRSACRYGYPRGGRGDSIGFRVVVSGSSP